MEKVLFISVETGDDLIVSFVTPGDSYYEGDFMDIKNFIMLRTPKYEHLLPDSDRGVKITQDNFYNEEDEFLQKIVFSKETIQVTSSRTTYKFDINGIEKDDLTKAMNICKDMNFDSRFKYKTA